MTFLRTLGSKAKLIPYKATDQLSGKHGDILYDPEIQYRAQGFFVITEIPELSIIRLDTSCQYGIIPKSVTSLIEDPMDFYEEIGEDELIGTIELDPVCHQKLLQKFTEGRVLRADAKIIWLILDGPVPQILLRSGYCDLSEETPDEYFEDEQNK
jgi:hypothetical protein